MMPRCLFARPSRWACSMYLPCSWATCPRFLSSVAGVVTLVQLFSIGPVGGQVPIIMGTSSGFLGVFNSVAASMGGGVLAYGAIMGASILGGLFETVLGFFLKPLRKFFPSVVTGTVVLSIGLSLISVGVNSFGGGNAAKDFGSAENLLLAVQAHHSNSFRWFKVRDHRWHCRGCGVHQGMGAELEQGGTGRLVCHPQAGSRQDHF